MKESARKPYPDATWDYTNFESCLLDFLGHLEFLFCRMEGYAIVYLDNVLVFSGDPEGYFCHLHLVFDQLKQQGLKLKLQKYQFLKKGAGYIGFLINKKGVKPDMDMMEVIGFMLEFRLVKGFIGVMGY